MSTTIANVYGSNLARLAVEQFGNNRAEGILTNPLLSDAAKYIVQLESFFISSDVPIFPIDTEVFRIYDATAEELRARVTVGPVYNWLDFAFQIQQQLLQTVYPDGAELELDGSRLSQKTLCFTGNETFWNDYMIQFQHPFDKIFEKTEMWMRTEYTGYLGAQVFVTSITSDVLMLDGDMWHDISEDIFDPDDDYFLEDPDDRYTLATKSRMDLFDNRHQVRIDSVLPLPHEIFCVGQKDDQTAKVSHRYTFFEFDFPKEVMTNTMTVDDGVVSDNRKITQELHTGIMRLIKPSPHSGLKRMLAGQSQNHRYEIFIIRKRFKDDGTVELKEERWPMSVGDFFRLVILFTQEV